MFPVLDLRGDRSDPTARLPRAAATTVAATRQTVAQILAAVREDGDEAVRRYSERFDGWGGGDLEVGAGDARRALDALDPALRRALERAAEQVGWFHERSKPRDWSEQRAGATLGVRHRPIRRVGVYVPGGLAAYPSTVLMTVVPAQVAGVGEVVLCTPPGADGAVNEAILAAAALVGVERVLRIGGAQAIAAMAYGTASVPRCDKVVGPGNAYVAAAKQQVAAEGACGIDGVAGVTEIAIIADDSADPRHVAADLVAQAEHDPQAACLLVTPSTDLVERVTRELRRQIPATRHRERVETALTAQGAAIVVDDLDHAVSVANAFAAEHLEVQTVDAAAVAGRIRAAGSLFVGATTPVSLGDYCAGPNHTLPTAGTARFSGGLRTDDFMVPINWVEYDRAGLAALAPVVEALGAAEGLPAHARAVGIRLEDPA